MKKNDEELFRDIRGEVDSGVSAVGDRPEAETGSLCVFNDSRLHQGHSGNKDRESSDILRIYLRSLGYCGRKNRRRCISQELGR